MAPTQPSKVIDFDLYRKERAAKENEGPPPEPVVFRIGGKDYPLPTDPPATIVLDVIRLKETKGTDATAPIEALASLGAAMFGEENFREILTVNKIGAAEMGDLIIQAFGAWPDSTEEKPSPNRATRRRKPTSS
jgi:hypothetical protein